jgi:membrane fusion protein
MTPLYRTEALAAQHAAPRGGIVLVRPLSFALFSSAAAAMALIIILFLVCGTYTRRSMVAGQLVPDAGLIRIHVPQPGVVLERHVTENQLVHAGDVLFVVSSDRQGESGEIQSQIGAQITARQDSLRGELAATRQLQQHERDTLAAKLESQKGQLALMQQQIDGQRNRIELARGTLDTYKGLLAKSYVAPEQVRQKQGELLELQAQLQLLERERIGLQHEIEAQQQELAGLASRQDNQRAELERALSNTEQEYSENEARRRIVLAAPETGTATAVTADAGQAVNPDLPLLSIVPAGSALHAELYAPSRAVGFIRPGDHVLLRYAAYPYQKFGHQPGTVSWVSRAPLPRGEVAGLAGAAADGEPLYRIGVTLRAQAVQAYGMAQPLQPGMQLDADVLQERRRLYEWMLDPLFSLRGGS